MSKMQQKTDARERILEIKKEVGGLNAEKRGLLKELRESCRHSGNIVYWFEAWSEYTVVKYYQCLDCGLIELDQQLEQINTEGATRTYTGKNRDLL